MRGIQRGVKKGDYSLSYPPSLGYAWGYSDSCLRVELGDGPETFTQYDGPESFFASHRYNSVNIGPVFTVRGNRQSVLRGQVSQNVCDRCDVTSTIAGRRADRRTA